LYLTAGLPALFWANANEARKAINTPDINVKFFMENIPYNEIGYKEKWIERHYTSKVAMLIPKQINGETDQKVSQIFINFYYLD
jgi:hypothetical protein